MNGYGDSDDLRFHASAGGFLRYGGRNDSTERLQRRLEAERREVEVELTVSEFERPTTSGRAGVPCLQQKFAASA